MFSSFYPISVVGVRVFLIRTIRLHTFKTTASLRWSATVNSIFQTDVWQTHMHRRTSPDVSVLRSFLEKRMRLI